MDFAWLVGGDLTSEVLIPGETIELLLYWEAAAETTTRYRVFVHLRDQENRIVAQSDGEPAEWTRPTTSWLAGEIIADRHRLQIPPNLPPGIYTLYTGLYTSAGGPIGEIPLTVLPAAGR